MSHLSRDKYTVFLSPSSMSMTHQRLSISQFGYKTVDSFVLDQDIQLTRDYSHYIHNLNFLLKSVKAKSRINIVVSNHFVRYKLIPSLPPFTNHEQSHSIALHCFKEVYGDLVESWNIQLDRLPHGHNVIACAIDAELIISIKQTAKDLGLILSSIQPHLMSGFNQVKSQFGITASCFFQIEAGRVILLLLKDGSFEAIASNPYQGNGFKELLSLMAREMALIGWGEEQPAIYLLDSCTQDIHQSQVDGWQYKPLKSSMSLYTQAVL